MSETATRTSGGSMIWNPVTYFRVTGFALAAVALLGIVMNIVDNNAVSTSLGFGNTFLNFTWPHNIVHVLLAAVAFLMGFGNLSTSAVKTFAIIIGAVYLALGVVGFFLFNGAGDKFLALTPTLNVIHILI